MEGGHVIELLARQEEEGVEELGELAEEVPPGSAGHAISCKRMQKLFFTFKNV